MQLSLNYYQVLQVDRRAEPKVIERVYKTLMLELRAHPDLGGDEERARLINVAYHTLRDPERRRAYDDDLAIREMAQETAEENHLAVLVRPPAPIPDARATPKANPDPILEFDEPGSSYPARCPRCSETHDVAHRLAADERLQCPNCHWFFRDPLRELAALRARIVRLPERSRPLAMKLYQAVLLTHDKAERAATLGKDTMARQALQEKREKLQLLIDEVRWVRF